MIERIFIHNYKGFVNFEMKFGRTVLLVGRNGTGKSSLIDVLDWLVSDVLLRGDLNEFLPQSRFRFGDEPTQRFEMDIRLAGQLFTYSIELGYDDAGPLVIQEELVANGKQLVSRDTNDLWLVDGNGNRTRVHGWGTVRKGAATEILDRPWMSELRDWATGFCALRLRPKLVTDLAEETPFLSQDGSSFVVWHQSVANRYPDLNAEYLRAITEVIPGLQTIRLNPTPGGTLLQAEFAGTRNHFTLADLSEGEVSLMILYAALYFSLRRGMTIALDGPDNYLALSEIEPFLHALSDAVDEKHGQVFLSSHHPEIYNRWTRNSERCRYLARTEESQFVACEIDWNKYPGLMPAEVVARGWEDS